MPSDLDLVLGGAGSATQALAPYEQRRQDQLTRDQPLSPFERVVGLITSGRLSPREAAVRLRTGMPLGDEPQAPGGVSGGVGSWPDPFGGGPGGPSLPVSGGPQQAPPQTPPQALQASPAPAQGPSYGYTPGMGGQAPQAQQGGMIPYPAQQPPPRMQQTSTATAPQAPMGPQTRGDLATLFQAAPFLQRGEQSDMRSLIELMKEQGRNSRNVSDNRTKERGQNIRGSIAANQLNESARQHDENLQLGYDSLQNKLDGITMAIKGASERAGLGREQNLELAAIKLRHAELLRLQSNLASMLNGIANIAENPRAVAEIGAVKGQIQMLSDDLMQDIMQLQERGTARGGTPAQGGETTPEGIKEPPAGSVAPPSKEVKAAPDGGYSKLKGPGVTKVSGGGSTTSAGATNGNPNKKVMVVGPNGQSGMAAETGLDEWLKAHPGWKRK